MFAATSQRRWHRRVTRPAGAWLAVIALGSLACAGTAHEPAPLDPALAAGDVLRAPDDPSIFVMTARQKPRIIASLEAAELPVAIELLEAGYTLRVTIGAAHATQSCGTHNNVTYRLKRNGVSIALLIQKGWTGSCTPNVFDALSRQLATHLRVLTARGPLRAID